MFKITLDTTYVSNYAVSSSTEYVAVETALTGVSVLFQTHNNYCQHKMYLFVMYIKNK